jgi:hypothetical protein
MQTANHCIVSKDDAMVKVPRYKERAVKDSDGELVIFVCEMVLSTEEGIFLLDYGLSPPDARGAALQFPVITITLKMTPEVFLKILQQPQLAVELNNKIHIICRNGLIMRMNVKGINEIKDPDMTPFIDLLISEPLPDRLAERTEDTWIPEKVSPLPAIEEVLAQRDPVAFEASFVWHKIFVLRQPLPEDMDDTRELFLERKGAEKTADTELQAAANTKAGAIRAYFKRFPMLARVDKIRVRPNSVTHTVVQLVDGLVEGVDERVN